MPKPGKFELWRMRIEQYIQMIDYAMWEVIEKGATLPKTVVVEGVEKVMPIYYVKIGSEKTRVKARRTLDDGDLVGLMHNKKYQRNLLKQQYENFTAPSSEMLDQTFDRLQKLMSQLELLDKKLSQEDVNQKLLRSLSPEWEGSLLLMAMRLLVLISPKWSATTATRGDILLGSAELQEIKDKSNKDIAQEECAYGNIFFYSFGGLGYEKYNAVPPPYTGNFLPPIPDLSFTALDEFVNKPVVENKKYDEEVSKVVWKSDDSLIIEDWMSDSEEENVSQTKTKKKTVKPSIAKIEFVKPKQHEKTARKIVKVVEEENIANTHNPRGNQRNWNNLMSHKLGNNFEMFNKACYVCGNFDHLQVDCNYHQK
ncbi:hypothetical protein Tco_0351572 [Tanacetum coccineum]